MADDKDNEIPESGAVFTYGRSRFADNEPNRFWIRDDPVINVVCGDEHTAVITHKGRLFTFGSNDWGQLGHGNSKVHNSPTSVKALKGERIVQVACGKAHTIVYLDSDTVYAFGCNEEGQLGTGDYESSSIPKEVRGLRGENLKQLAAGAQHSMALTSDGHVVVWGCHADGQLGLGKAEEQHPQPTDLQLKHHIVQIACGYHHSALITKSGDLLTFGDGEGGKLGLGNDRTISSPQKVTGIDEKIEQVSCGGDHTAFVTSNARLYVFGSGSSGQLGLGNSKHISHHPTIVEKLSGTKISSVSCGYSHTAIVSELQCVYVFGDGRFGKLGFEGREVSQATPKRIDRFSHFNVTKAACGGSHTIIIAEPCYDWKRREEQVSKSGRRLKFRDIDNSEDEGLPESEESFPGARAARRRMKEDRLPSSHRLSKSLDLNASAREHDMKAHSRLPPLLVDRARQAQTLKRYDDSDESSPQRHRSSPPGSADSSDEGISESRKEKPIARFRRHSTSSRESEDHRTMPAAYGRGGSQRQDVDYRAKDHFVKKPAYNSPSETSESEEESERKSAVRHRARSRSASDDESSRYRNPTKSKRLTRRGSFDVPPSKSKLLHMEQDEDAKTTKSHFPSWLFKKKADKKLDSQTKADKRGRKEMFVEDNDKDSRAKSKSKTCVVS